MALDLHLTSPILTSVTSRQRASLYKSFLAPAPGKCRERRHPCKGASQCLDLCCRNPDVHISVSPRCQGDLPRKPTYLIIRCQVVNEINEVYNYFSASLSQCSRSRPGAVLSLGPMTNPTNKAILFSFRDRWLAMLCVLGATLAQRSRRTSFSWHSDGRLVHIFSVP